MAPVSILLVSTGILMDPGEIATGFYWHSTGIFLMVSTGNHFTFHIQTSRKNSSRNQQEALLDPVEIPTGFYWSSTGLLLDPVEIPTGFYWYSTGLLLVLYWIQQRFLLVSTGILLAFF